MLLRICQNARCVELPDEDKADGEHMVGELNFSMYGTSDAAQNWGESCASTMENIGWYVAKLQRALSTILTQGRGATFMATTASPSAWIKVSNG